MLTKLANKGLITDSTTGHESSIGDFVNIGPGSNINGVNKIEKGAFVGTGIITKEDIIVGEWSVIGAGTIVVTNVPKNSLFLGYQEN